MSGERDLPAIPTSADTFTSDVRQWDSTFKELSNKLDQLKEMDPKDWVPNGDHATLEDAIISQEQLIELSLSMKSMFIECREIEMQSGKVVDRIDL